LADIGKTSAPETFATDDGTPTQLAIDADRLFWINWSYGEVKSKPLGVGTGLTPLDYTTQGGMPVALTLDETHVYWLNYDGSVNAARKEAGKTTTVACAAPELGVGYAIAVDCGAVYWTTTSSPEP